MAVGIETFHQEKPTMTGMTNTTKKGGIMSPPRRLARIAGLFYLLVGITGGFSEGFVDPKLHVGGNAAATAANVVANAGLVRIGVAAHLLDGIFFISTALVLYILLQHVHKSVARAMLVFVALAVGIKCLNTMFLFEGLQVALDSSYAAAFGTSGSNALVLMLLDIQHYGTLSGQVFFGLWLAPLGYLAIKSGLFPKALGAWDAEPQRSAGESALRTARSSQPLDEPLSEREIQILQLVAHGCSNREISESLFLALDTVKGHNRRTYAKLGVQRRTEAVARARELGLL